MENVFEALSPVNIKFWLIRTWLQHFLFLNKSSFIDESLKSALWRFNGEIKQMKSEFEKGKRTWLNNQLIVTWNKN